MIPNRLTFIGVLRPPERYIVVDKITFCLFTDWSNGRQPHPVLFTEEVSEPYDMLIYVYSLWQTLW